MNVLFVCNQGKHRSRAAAEIFSDSFSTQYAGVFNNFVTKEKIEWADTVVLMEEFQREELKQVFPEAFLTKKIFTAGIPDVYSYGNPRLKQDLLDRVTPLFD